MIRDQNLFLLDLFFYIRFKGSSIYFFNSLISLLLNGRINKSTLQFHCWTSHNIKNDHFIVLLYWCNRFFSWESFCWILWIKKIPFYAFFMREFYLMILENIFLSTEISFLVAHLKIKIKLGAENTKDCHWPIVHDKWPQIELRAILCETKWNVMKRRTRSGGSVGKVLPAAIKVPSDGHMWSNLSESEKCHSRGREKRRYCWFVLSQHINRSPNV